MRKLNDWRSRFIPCGPCHGGLGGGIHFEILLFGVGNRRLPKTYCQKSHALLSDEEEKMKPSRRKDYL